MTALDLANESPLEGRQAVLTALAELRRAGYIVQRRRQMSGGRWHTETFVYDTPQAAGDVFTEVRSPDSGWPDVGWPDAGQPDRIEKEQKKKQKKEQENTQEERADGLRPSVRRACGPLSGGGGIPGKYITDKETKISLQAGNAADLQAINEIKRYSPPKIETAVARARATEPTGRAYPSAVLRLLRRAEAAGSTGSAAAPAWAMAGHTVTEIDITNEGETL